MCDVRKHCLRKQPLELRAIGFILLFIKVCTKSYFIAHFDEELQETLHPHGCVVVNDCPTVLSSLTALSSLPS
jgi:hypothetical protein